MFWPCKEVSSQVTFAGLQGLFRAPRRCSIFALLAQWLRRTSVAPFTLALFSLWAVIPSSILLLIRTSVQQSRHLFTALCPVVQRLERALNRKPRCVRTRSDRNYLLLVVFSNKMREHADKLLTWMNRIRISETFNYFWKL